MRTSSCAETLYASSRTILTPQRSRNTLCRNVFVGAHESAFYVTTEPGRRIAAWAPKIHQKQYLAEKALRCEYLRFWKARSIAARNALRLSHLRR
jgi:hypothetical protein